MSQSAAKTPNIRKNVDAILRGKPEKASKDLKGTYEHNLDAKGRLFIPSKLKDGLGDSFVITRGLDGCLAAYSTEAWRELEAKISALPLSQARDLQRYFFSSAMDCELDAQGRVVIPQSLRQFAGLDKEAVVVGMINRVEIWSADKWQGYSQGFDEKNIISAMETLQI